jgi:hypothetical protein
MNNQLTPKQLSDAVDAALERKRSAEAIAYGAMRGYVLHGDGDPDCKQHALDALAEADDAAARYNVAYEAWNDAWKASR